MYAEACISRHNKTKLRIFSNALFYIKFKYLFDLSTSEVKIKYTESVCSP